MKKLINLALLIIIILGSYSIGYRLFSPDSCGAACQPQITSVSAAEFNKELSENNVTVIDVRTKEEFESGHIDGALNADVNSRFSFDTFVRSLDPNGRYLIYCRTGNRSKTAMQIMKEKGFTNLTDLSGGIVAWQDAGFTVQTN